MITGRTKTLPQGFTLRRPSMADVDAVAQVIRACEIEFEGVADTTANDIRVHWTDPTFDITKDAWIVLSPQGQVVAMASIEEQEHARIFCGADVLGAYRGLGIGTHLLEMTEARALEHLPLAPADARVSILTWTKAKEVAAHRLLEKHGYQRIRSSWRMAIELHEAPPAPVWPEGITLVTLAANPDRLHAVYEADEEFFSDHWGHMPHSFAEFEHHMTKRENFDPSLWFIAMAGDKIAGISLCADEKASGGWVHSLAIGRHWRRQGLGLALLHHSFGELYRRGIHTIYLGVDAQSLTGATRLYERAGMRVVQQYYTYEKELRAGRELSTQSVQ